MKTISDLYESVESKLGESLITRNKQLKQFPGSYSIPDLIHLVKEDNSKDITKPIGFYHHCVGVDFANGLSSVAAYFGRLLSTQQKKSRISFNRSNWVIVAGTYCTYDPISKTDLRVSFRLPGTFFPSYIKVNKIKKGTKKKTPKKKEKENQNKSNLQNNRENKKANKPQIKHQKKEKDKKQQEQEKEKVTENGKENENEKEKEKEKEEEEENDTYKQNESNNKEESESESKYEDQLWKNFTLASFIRTWCIKIKFSRFPGLIIRDEFDPFQQKNTENKKFQQILKHAQAILKKGLGSKLNHENKYFIPTKGNNVLTTTLLKFFVKNFMYEIGEDFFSQLLDSNPEFSVPISKIWRKTNRTKQSIKLLLKSLHSIPGSNCILSELYKCYFQLCDYQKAKYCAKKFCILLPFYPKSWLMLANIRLKQKKYLKYIELLNQIPYYFDNNNRNYKYKNNNTNSHDNSKNRDLDINKNFKRNNKTNENKNNHKHNHNEKDKHNQGHNHNHNHHYNFQNYPKPIEITKPINTNWIPPEQSTIKKMRMAIKKNNIFSLLIEQPKKQTYGYLIIKLLNKMYNKIGWSKLIDYYHIFFEKFEKNSLIENNINNIIQKKKLKTGLIPHEDTLSEKYWVNWLKLQEHREDFEDNKNDKLNNNSYFDMLFENTGKEPKNILYHGGILNFKFESTLNSNFNYNSDSDSNFTSRPNLNTTSNSNLNSNSNSNLNSEPKKKQIFNIEEIKIKNTTKLGYYGGSESEGKFKEINKFLVKKKSLENIGMNNNNKKLLKKFSKYSIEKKRLPHTWLKENFFIVINDCKIYHKISIDSDPSQWEKDRIKQTSRIEWETIGDLCNRLFKIKEAKRAYLNVISLTKKPDILYFYVTSKLLTILNLKKDFKKIIEMCTILLKFKDFDQKNHKLNLKFQKQLVASICLLIHIHGFSYLRRYLKKNNTKRFQLINNYLTQLIENSKNLKIHGYDK
ncbi:bud site selection protein [Anaeramoeba flamelloides]|uniref:Bud site selection protein n=1 Tax=Anaeramoeba flamelloides TaxID=1746091 RepID=A0ABQ8XPR5_9EUKA|nr:bud site selection protein [Anaeramoeba flamelloides]